MPPTELNPCIIAKWRNTGRRHLESFRPPPMFSFRTRLKCLLRRFGIDKC